MRVIYRIPWKINNHNEMKNRIKFLFLALSILGLLNSCDNGGTVPDPDPGGDTSTEVPAITRKVNKFIFDAMSDVYLWYNQMPDIDYNYENDSKAYFNKLLYVDDKWSYITDDIQSLENSFQGIEKTYGWSLAFGIFSNTGTYFAIVEYVYPNTPAAIAGIKRGDIIMMINGGDITDKNYTDLLYGENISFTLGVLGENGISEGQSINLTALELDLNPVLKTSVTEYEGKKIGYIFYAQYISKYDNAIDTALQSLVNQGVTDVVLDLRYNPGGEISAAQHLCSSLAPSEIVENERTLVTLRWNDKYQSYWTSGQQMSQIEVDFIDSTTPVKMNLDKIHILTGSGTASASELTITGLAPYMTVTTVGDTTYGKYTASITIKPEDMYSSSYTSDFDNWGLQPIVARYANAFGVTDFKDGFAPDIEVEDDLFNAYPLGDLNDPLFAAAVEDITGTPVVTAIKSARKPHPGYRIFDRGFSRFDPNKRQLLIDNNFTWLRDTGSN